MLFLVNFLKESRLKGTKENGTGMGNELDLHEIN
jgi:hypothetical protein